ncbi:hypothetical protein HK096_002029, partial [Nowakowskiella sp. JEL0078]
MTLGAVRFANLFNINKLIMGFVHLDYDTYCNLSVVKDDSQIEGLAMTVHGKVDQHPVTLMLWADHNIPKLCPILHLITYISATGYESGYLFPTKEIIENLLIDV